MNIALFADVHGRVALCFDLCARWQQMTGERVDLILQAGDLGVFPDPRRLDSATLRYSRDDPTELGFMEHFATPNDKIEALLAKTEAPLIFVRGNHEDHAWLDRKESHHQGPQFPVDVYGRVHCLKTGIPYTHTAGDTAVTVVGIGRVGRSSQSKPPQPKHIQDYERRQLNRHDHITPDILLTHDTALSGFRRSGGMQAIRDYLDSHQPTYHVWGHVGGGLIYTDDDNGVTESIKLPDLVWEKSGELPADCFGMLRWHGPDEHRFEVVEMPWRIWPWDWPYRPA